MIEHVDGSTAGTSWDPAGQIEFVESLEHAFGAVCQVGYVLAPPGVTDAETLAQVLGGDWISIEFVQSGLVLFRRVVGELVPKLGGAVAGAQDAMGRDGSAGA